MIATWSRQRLTLGGVPIQVALVAISPVKLPDPLPVSRSRHGMPDGEAAAAVSLAVRSRTEHAEWFVSFDGSGLAQTIAEDLGPDVLAQARAAEFAYVIEVELDEAEDFGYLQAAWALAMCVAEGGAIAVVDTFAARAWTGTEVAKLAAARAFDPLHEVSIVVGAASDAADEMLIFTRGLGKLGRADIVVVGVAQEEVAGIAQLVSSLVSSLAEGDLLEAGDHLELDDGGRYVAQSITDAMAAGLELPLTTLVLAKAAPVS